MGGMSAYFVYYILFLFNRQLNKWINGCLMFDPIKGIKAQLLMIDIKLNYFFVCAAHEQLINMENIWHFCFFFVWDFSGFTKNFLKAQRDPNCVENLRKISKMEA